jgi:hypothetical protein
MLTLGVIFLVFALLMFLGLEVVTAALVVGAGLVVVAVLMGDTFPFVKR